MSRNEPGERTTGMSRPEGGSFRIDCESFYREEAPVHTVAVDGFWIDSRPVTVRKFRHFVRDTG